MKRPSAAPMPEREGIIWTTRSSVEGAVAVSRHGSPSFKTLSNAMSKERPSIRLKRAYAPKTQDDGLRLLVERLWPRGLKREDAAIDRWFKALAPSPELRRWYDHVPERWPDFRRRYLAELAEADREEIYALAELCRDQNVTFIFAARDETRNSATILREYVLKMLGKC